MDFEFKLPDLGEGIVEGEVVKWLVKEGASVTEDMPLLEVMTDKATVEITSPKVGKIGKILVKEGEIVKVEQPMVIIVVEGGSASAAPSHGHSHSAPASAPIAADRQVTTPAAPAAGSGANVQASPATRKLARELGVDLGLVPGTGPGGRVTNEDVQNFQAKGGAPKAASPSPAPVATHAAAAVSVDGPVERIAFRGLRKKIAEKMAQSTHTAAHFSYVDTVDMTAIVALRDSWKKDAEAKGAKLTYLPFFMKAVVEALKAHPRFNASLDEEKQEIVLKKYYNLGIATATEQGLIVPVIKDCDKKSVLALSKEVAELTERTRHMKAQLDELRGSTFTITSLGALGGLFATPIINHPDTAIMGIYQIKPTPVVVDGRIEVRQIMYFSLSLDHRVIDGHEAASFGNLFKKHLEDPKAFFTRLDG